MLSELQMLVHAALRVGTQVNAMRFPDMQKCKTGVAKYGCGFVVSLMLVLTKGIILRASQKNLQKLCTRGHVSPLLLTYGIAAGIELCLGICRKDSKAVAARVNSLPADVQQPLLSNGDMQAVLDDVHGCGTEHLA